MMDRVRVQLRLQTHSCKTDVFIAAFTAAAADMIARIYLQTRRIGRDLHGSSRSRIGQSGRQANLIMHRIKAVILIEST